MAGISALQSVAQALVDDFVRPERGRINWRVRRIISALYAEEGAVFTFDLLTGKPGPLAVIVKSLARHQRIQFLHHLDEHGIDGATVTEATLDVELEGPFEGEPSQFLVWAALTDRDGQTVRAEAECTVVPLPTTAWRRFALRRQLAAGLRHRDAPVTAR